MSDAYCTDCKKETELVVDHSAGDTLCSECGLVLESHSIDETSEWRTFANESSNADPNRVGGPTNPLLADSALTTVIAKTNGSSGDFLSNSLGRWQNRNGNPERGLMQAFKTIATMSDRFMSCCVFICGITLLSLVIYLVVGVGVGVGVGVELGLVGTIKDRANEIFKRLEDQKSTRGRNQDALLAACLYISCRQEDKPRTIKEICSVANGATKKEMGRAKDFIVKTLGLETGHSVEMGAIHAGDFMPDSCLAVCFICGYVWCGITLSTNITKRMFLFDLFIERLGLVGTIKDRANEIFKRLEDQKSTRGRNQDALLAACLYISCRQEDKPRTIKEICSVANGATKKEMGRAKDFIVKTLGLETGHSVEMGAIHAGDFMKRFCSNLGMSHQAVRAAEEAVKKSEEFDIRRSPISIAAVVIYIITQLSDDKKPLKDIAIATGVAEGTIRNSYKDLYPHLQKIAPSWYAKEEDLKNLSSP
ncbi:hypothetical protein DY000_02028476 [Brassica cretica]|uniref:TFIIB-type domain-containing protein n=1 Tax=Brassica cretica TaxID=69181 RepID=A0ABQ7DR06_BRACR|nr:hypothetical protein DY000_02028476 [Brassica cretica]